MNDKKNNEHLNRREFLALTAASVSALSVTGCAGMAADESSGSSDGNWFRGDVSHLLPLVNHQSILIKASFRTALTNSPRLRIDNQEVTGIRSGSGC